MTLLQSPSDRSNALSQLHREMRKALPGKRLVFGEGPPDAGLAIVGEAPGLEEEESGHPFVGRAGQLLCHLLSEAALQRDHIWITNVVKWRPTDDGRTRSPRAAEVEQSRGWLLREIEIVHPALILCVGNVAARALLGARFSMTAERGQWRQCPLGIPTLATFHPAYALRFDDEPLAAIREDIHKVKARLEHHYPWIPRSDKSCPTIERLSSGRFRYPKLKPGA